MRKQAARSRKEVWPERLTYNAAVGAMPTTPARALACIDGSWMRDLMDGAGSGRPITRLNRLVYIARGMGVFALFFPGAAGFLQHR